VVVNRRSNIRVLSAFTASYLYLLSVLHVFGQPLRVTDGWIKMPLGVQVGLIQGNVVLDAYPAAPHGKGHSSPPFWPMSVVAKCWPISATAELLFINVMTVMTCLAFNM